MYGGGGGGAHVEVGDGDIGDSSEPRSRSTDLLGRFFTWLVTILELLSLHPCADRHLAEASGNLGRGNTTPRSAYTTHTGMWWELRVNSDQILLSEKSLPVVGMPTENWLYKSIW